MDANYSSTVVEGSQLLDLNTVVGAKQGEQLVGWVEGTQPNTGILFNDAMLGRHVLYLGGIGTGKTVGMEALINSLRGAAQPNDVFVIFDTKGEYYEKFYRPGDAVIAGSSEVGYHGATIWNLFEELKATPPGRQIEDEILEVAQAIFGGVTKNAGDNNVYWANAARDVFVALVTAMLREGGREHSNADLRRIVGAMSVAEMHEMLGRPENKDLIGAKHYIAKEGSNSTNAVMSFMQQAIQESFRSRFGLPGDFSVRRFLREKNARALFLEYDIAAGTALDPVFRVLLDLAMKEAMSRSRAGGRVIFILDEFALLPELTHLSNGLNFGRSLGLRFVVGTQNIKQVQEAYGDNMAFSILSGFGTVFSFRLFDADSREFVQGRFGKNRKLQRFDSTVRNKGINENTADGYVVEDWDLSGLPVGWCIAAIPEAAAPFRFNFKKIT